MDNLSNEVLAYIALAVSQAPATNTVELRYKAEALKALAEKLENDSKPLDSSIPASP